jgi:hypothetical protein
VSAIDDIISGIDGVIEQITEATTATSGVLQEAEQALATAEALGANAAIEGLNCGQGTIGGAVRSDRCCHHFG